jgi:hypothetical protein
VNVDLEHFRLTLEDGIENEINGQAEELARSIVATVWNAVDDQLGAQRQHIADADQHRDFYRRSADHLAAKRDLAESVLGEWEDGRLPADRALRMIRAALAVGDVKTIGQLLTEAVS